jgi:predicted aspartyl protease
MRKNRIGETPCFSQAETKSDRKVFGFFTAQFHLIAFIVPRQIQKLRLDKPERRFRLECNFMKIIRAMIASAVLMILCSCATHAAVRPSLPAETFFNKEAGRDQRIYLTLHLENGGELLFIADTGASDTVLTGPWSRFWENVWEREKFIGWEK